MDGQIVLGCDCARFGEDFSVVCAMLDDMVIALWSWQGNDLMQTTGKIAHLLRTIPNSIAAVDSIGIGSGVCDRLYEQNLNCVAVNVGESPNDKEHFMNLRAELYWKLHDDFRDGKIDLTRLKQEDYDRLSGELTAILYEYTSKGQLKIEAKEELKKRLNGASPDFADALMLTRTTKSAIPGIGII